MLLLRLLAILLLPALAYAQLTDDFEDGLTGGWSVEGDGSVSVSQDIDAPNYSLLINDDVTGSISYAIAPSRYLGDYSAATAADSLRTRIYLQSSVTSVASLEDSPVYELVGPGGRARTEVGRVLPAGEWTSLAVSFNPIDWDLVSGNWTDLLADVQLLRIRTEYRNGTERVYLDDIRVDVSPVHRGFAEAVCSDFTDGSLDGWRFVDAGPATVDTSAGNPGGAVRIGDRLGVTTLALAPPKFRGDWSILPDSSYLQFDLRIEAGANPTIFDQPYLIRLAGTDAAATYDLPPADFLPATTDYATFRLPLIASAWAVERGSWSELLAAVDSVVLLAEYVDGGETVLLDNFCLVPGELVNATFTTVDDAGIHLFPNPAYGQLNITADEARILSVSAFDLSGRELLSEVVSTSTHQLQLDYRGGVIVRVLTTWGPVYRRLIFR